MKIGNKKFEVGTVVSINGVNGLYIVYEIQNTLSESVDGIEGYYSVFVFRYRDEQEKDFILENPFIDNITWVSEPTDTTRKLVKKFLKQLEEEQEEEQEEEEDDSNMSSELFDKFGHFMGYVRQLMREGDETLSDQQLLQRLLTRI